MDWGKGDAREGKEGGREGGDSHLTVYGRALVVA